MTLDEALRLFGEWDFSVLVKADTERGGFIVSVLHDDGDVFKTKRGDTVLDALADIAGYHSVLASKFEDE